MLFNSLSFLLIYAPLVIAGFFTIGARRPAHAIAWLGLMSLVFYGAWRPIHTLILLASIICNFYAGVSIRRAGDNSSLSRKNRLRIAVTLNLLALCYYKYMGFFGHLAANALGWNWSFGEIALPLGISFFTFTQIAYLVDTYEGKVKEHDFLRYLLFVTYFPHLVAGPIIHHRDVMTQFAKPGTFRFHESNFTLGSCLFIIGLFKKVVIADNVALLASPVFDLAEHAMPLSAGVAWAGALAYTVQLYFDFSGYSDMAIGLSLIFNVRLPFNFDSPYKARSIVDFWRRWHISLSTFLRDYLYIPLGGNRRGRARRYANMGITMVLGGLWHGAGWTFLVWGTLHGTYLAINHFWRDHAPNSRLLKSPGFSTISWLATLLAVVIAWVFFRAETLGGGLRMLAAMAAQGSAPLQSIVLASGAQVTTVLAYCFIVPLLAITLWAPNSQEIVSRLQVDPDTFINWKTGMAGGAVWKEQPIFLACAFGLLLAAAMMCISRPTQFLYFNF